MDKDFFRFKWILLFTVFLTGQFFLNSSAWAEWTVVDSPDVSSDWGLFNPRFNWAVGQDSENKTGVLLYFANGSWISATLPNVSSDWALSGVDLTHSDRGWAVGQDFENTRGVLIYFTNPVVVGLPAVSTTAISNITDTTATGGGSVISDGGTEVTARGVCWSASANPDVKGNGTCTSDGTGTGVFTSSITGLTSNTLYHVRAYATNSVGTAYGSDLTFSTTISPLPILTTTPISNITATTATGGGNITSDGGTPVTQRGVCWNTSGNPDIEGTATCTNDGTGTGAFTSFFFNLVPSTQYHVRAYASNSAGTGYGSDLTFSTTASTQALATLTTTPTLKATAASGAGLIWPSGTVTPPNVSSDWGLSAVHFSSSDMGWAVGEDFENTRGVLLHFLRGVWISVLPPNVSSDWGLSAVHFRWAVGQDLENMRGVILYYSGGSWTSIMPPNVSSDWGLSAVHFLSSNEAWAVGQDTENGRGVLLHYLDGSWRSVSPPVVSSNWGLSSVDFISSNEGWAVGKDFENGRGVLLHFLNGSWTSVSPPDVSSDWGLSGIHLISPTKGWAVGSDSSNLKGVLLRYTVPQISVSPTRINFSDVEKGALLEETVTVKNTGNGDLLIGTITEPSPPFSISADSCSGQSLAWSRTCKVTYRFLPTSAGTISSNSNIPSNGSQNPVTVTLTGTGVGETLNYINPLSPPYGETFTACSYTDPPIFQWESSGTFASVEVQFSDIYDLSRVSLKVMGDPNVNQLVMKPNVWKKVLFVPGSYGGPLYWRVVAEKKDKTLVKSDILSFDVDPRESVQNPQMSHTSKATLLPPTLSWENYCNVKFTVWFGNDYDFKNRSMRKIPIYFNIKYSGGIPETFTKELTSRQWYSIRKLGGDITGATLYWYVESWDILGRRASTDVMSFVLTN